MEPIVPAEQPGLPAEQGSNVLQPGEERVFLVPKRRFLHIRTHGGDQGNYHIKRVQPETAAEGAQWLVRNDDTVPLVVELLYDKDNPTFDEEHRNR